jgi:hypothetical protein
MARAILIGRVPIRAEISRKQELKGGALGAHSLISVFLSVNMPFRTKDGLFISFLSSAVVCARKGNPWLKKW